MASWCALFPLASVERLTATKSDYSPILLLNEMEAGNRRIALRKLFRYECMWEWHEQLKGVVLLAWQRQNGCTAGDLCAKLKSMAGSVMIWSKGSFGKSVLNSET